MTGRPRVGARLKGDQGFGMRIWGDLIAFAAPTLEENGEVEQGPVDPMQPHQKKSSERRHRQTASRRKAS